jgi:hypothetical protein
VPVAWPFMLMACYFGPSYYTLPHRVLLPKISRVGANLTVTCSPYEMMYGTKALLPSAIQEQFTQPSELTDPEQVSDYLL